MGNSGDIFVQAGTYGAFNNETYEDGLVLSFSGFGSFTIT
jgi:hypothetical protein